MFRKSDGKNQLHVNIKVFSPKYHLQRGSLKMKILSFLNLLNEFDKN